MFILCAHVDEIEDLLERIDSEILVPSQCMLEFLSLPSGQALTESWALVCLCLAAVLLCCVWGRAGGIAGGGHGSSDVACLQPGSCVVFLRSTLV